MFKPGVTVSIFLFTISSLRAKIIYCNLIVCRHSDVINEANNYTNKSFTIVKGVTTQENVRNLVRKRKLT